jgi:hypothetical protein
MRNRRALAGRGLGRADVHAAIDLHGIATQDFAAQRSASSSASALLPDAVGPKNRDRGGGRVGLPRWAPPSGSPQTLFDFGHGHAQKHRPAVRAVRAQVHGIELDQQRQRLFAADHVASAQGTVAGHGGEDLVEAGLGASPGSSLARPAITSSKQRLGIDLLEQIGHRAQKQGLGPEVLDLETQLAERLSAAPSRTAAMACSSISMGMGKSRRWRTT